GTTLSGLISREDRRFILSLNDRRIEQAATLESAAHRLAATLRKALPRQRDNNWGVAARCSLRPDVGLLFGNAQGGGGGGGALNPCVGRIIAEYQHGNDNLDRALEFAARLISNCCGG